MDLADFRLDAQQTTTAMGDMMSDLSVWASEGFMVTLGLVDDALRALRSDADDLADTLTGVSRSVDLVNDSAQGLGTAMGVQLLAAQSAAARDLGEALRRIGEGAAMIRTKGEAGTGNIVEAVRHARTVRGEIRRIQGMTEEELLATARDLRAPYDLVRGVHETGQLPVVNFAAGGIASPADAALMMQLGVDGVFVGSGIFKSEQPELMASAIVKATTNYNNPEILAEVSRGLGDAMPGLDVRTMPVEEQLATRGW